MKKHIHVFTIVLCCSALIACIAAVLGLDLLLALYGGAMVAVSAAAALLVSHVVLMDREPMEVTVEAATGWNPPTSDDYRVSAATRALNAAGIPYAPLNGGYCLCVRVALRQGERDADYYPTTRKWRLVNEPESVPVSGSIDDFIAWVKS